MSSTVQSDLATSYGTRLSRDILAVKMAQFNEEQIVAAVERTSSAYGYPQLKKEQRDVVLQFMSGRDVFCCLPTGFGKSVCYILLPMMFDTLNHKDAGTSSIIVISPLSSLMEDQVNVCESHHITAVAVKRENESSHHHDVLKGKYQIVYISPEMLLGTNKWRTVLQDERFHKRLCAVVIDEAHCVKKW